MEDIELKNCPFCNGEAVIEQQGTNRISTIYSCCDCGCRLETGETWQTPQRWNTRTSDTRISTLTAQLEEAREALQGLYDAHDMHSQTMETIREYVKIIGSGYDESAAVNRARVSAWLKASKVLRKAPLFNLNRQGVSMSQLCDICGSADGGIEIPENAQFRNMRIVCWKHYFAIEKIRGEEANAAWSSGKEWYVILRCNVTRRLKHLYRTSINNPYKLIKKRRR
jgi:hypothetical protein